MGEAKMKKILATENHEKFRREFIDLLRKYFRDEKPETLLAIASQSVGILAAYQDQRRISSELAMEIIATNLELGNEQALSSIDEQLKGMTKGH